MDVSLCIASRGHPIDLLRVIAECDARVSDPEHTTISVALDADDESTPAKPDTRCRLVWDVAPREDSLGGKYNRAARSAPAEIYALGADDNIFSADGWDQKIRDTMALFPQHFGFVYFGRLDGTLPTQMAIPHRLIGAQGFLFPPFFPFWFHDTWIDEIAHMTGRILWADIPVEEIGGRGKSRGLQEVRFWAALFEMLRGHREGVSDMLSQEHNEHWFQMQLKQRRDILRLFFRTRQEALLNPATAGQFERRMSYDAKPDERYQRIKANAEAIMRDLQRTAA